MSIILEGPKFGTSAVCTPILRSLPDWFGIEDAIVRYSNEIDSLPTFLARDSDREIGFLSLKQHNPFSAEIYVMGVLADHHNQGIGRGLVEAAQDWLRQQKVEYLQVKTLGPSKVDQGYANTRNFYLAMGFRPLEEISQIWDKNNPCLVMVKKI